MPVFSYQVTFSNAKNESFLTGPINIIPTTRNMYTAVTTMAEIAKMVAILYGSLRMFKCTYKNVHFCNKTTKTW